MTREEITPKRERWPEHLKDLGDRELEELAGDYCWLVEKNRPEEEREEFRRRREAILGECRRRGLTDAARRCLPAEGMKD